MYDFTVKGTEKVHVLVQALSDLNVTRVDAEVDGMLGEHNVDLVVEGGDRDVTVEATFGEDQGGMDFYFARDLAGITFMHMVRDVAGEDWAEDYGGGAVMKLVYDEEEGEWEVVFITTKRVVEDVDTTHVSAVLDREGRVLPT
jgi:hypothetical protein